MAERTIIQHSVLIVSASGQLDSVVKKNLAGDMLMSLEGRRSAAAARQSFLERYYDLIIVDSPLPDESGTGLVLDMSEQSNASVLLITERDRYEEVFDMVAPAGVYVLPRPFPRGRLRQVIRYLFAIRERLKKLERKLELSEERLLEVREVNRAKLMLIERKHMTEDEAHRFIGKWAMDRGISRKRAAEMLMEEL
ncbi:MAG TPA: hypothetical protein DCL38_05210 [Lachnospiraceae bacterium]|nr:hypothetical protein [Lachnospiraceae bacterium]